jgi:hypothetical protein
MAPPAAADHVRAALAALPADALRALVADALRLEGFARLSDAPRGSLCAERVELRHHGAPAERVRWIVRTVPADTGEAALLEHVRAAEADLYVCAARRLLLWCAGAVPPFVARMNEHLPARQRVEGWSGTRLAALCGHTPALLARHLPRLAPAPAGPYDGWRVLFLHDGSPLDERVLRKLQQGGAWCLPVNLLAQDAVREGAGDLLAEHWDLVAALAGDAAGASLTASAVEALAAHLARGGDVLWNPWVAWASHVAELQGLGALLPVEIAVPADTPPAEAVRERREMRVTTAATPHPATRGLADAAPFTLVNTFEPLRLGEGATALAASDDGTPLLAVATRGRGRSVYLNASGHSCASLAPRCTPLDDAPALEALLWATLGWLRETSAAASSTAGGAAMERAGATASDATDGAGGETPDRPVRGT